MKYDFIVIGAGSAGSIMATRLSENPSVSVLLIESGPDYPSLNELPGELKRGFASSTAVVTSDHNWDYYGQPTPFAEPMQVPRGKVTGGSSSINGQMDLLGIPEDFDKWAEWGNDEWSFEKTLPFMRKLETDLDYSGDFHGTDGPILVRRYKENQWLRPQSIFRSAALNLGYPEFSDLNHPDSEGISPTPLNNPHGIRWSTSLGYLGMSRHRLNLTIRAKCDVRRIIFEGTRAIGLEIFSEGELFKVFCENVILSAGAIGSPHLLMLSGIGNREELISNQIEVIHDLPGVGQNLRDHPVVYVSFKTKEEVEQKLIDGVSPRNQFCLRYTATDSSLRNDMVIMMNSFATRAMDRLGEPVDGYHVSMMVSLYSAVSSGSLSLQSADPDHQPFLDYNYFENPLDRSRMRDGIRRAIELSETEDFRTLVESRIEPLDSDLDSNASLDSWMMKEAVTGHHISGTCKMGPLSDPISFVDQHGNVHGLNGLRIVDASIMPDCIRANTNVTTMMIAERIYDMIK